MSIEIVFQRGEITLKGKIHLAQGNGPFTTIVLLHGIPGNEIDVLGLGQKLSDKGINVLTFNYSGTYKSDGLYSFANSQLDIQAAYTFLHQNEQIKRFKIDTSRFYIGGYSDGGGMALSYAVNHREINAVFSIAGNDHGEFMREYSKDKNLKNIVDNIFEKMKEQENVIRFAPNSTPKEIMEQNIDISPYDQRLNSKALASKQLLLIGGWDDSKVTIENYILPLYRKLLEENANKITIRAFQDGHSFDNTRNELMHAILEWINSIEHVSKISHK